MNRKKSKKEKTPRLKLTPPQQTSRLKSGEKEPFAPEEAPPEEPLSSKEKSLSSISPNESSAAPDSQKTESMEKVSSPTQPKEDNPPQEASVKPKKKESFLKALHKKAPLKKPIKKSTLEKELETLTNQYLYLKADFENYKKQTLKERSELFRYGGEEFIRALINEVLDDFDRAYSDLDHTKSLENFKSGIDLIYKNLQKTLNKFHIEAHDPQGQPFNPNHHEALSRQPTDKVPKDHVLITFKKAYTLYEKLIRPAQVIVAVPTDKSSNTS